MELQLPLLPQYPQHQSYTKKRAFLFSVIGISIAITITLAIVVSFNGQSIVISQNDKRQFECFTLSNGLQVLIIQNEEEASNYSYISISLAVGFLHDGDIRGISHLLEHLGFDQSLNQSYERNLFLVDCYLNAYTNLQETNYYFTIRQDSLFQLFYYLALFLKTPTFIQQEVNKETQIIEEEWH